MSSTLKPRAVNDLKKKINIRELEVIKSLSPGRESDTEALLRQKYAQLMRTRVETRCSDW